MLILVIDRTNNIKKIDIIIKVWIGALIMVLVLGLLGLFASIFSGKTNIFCLRYNGNFPYFNTIYRITSVFYHPSGLAAYLVVSLGFVFSELLLTNNEKYKALLKILLWIMFFIIITTISRELAAFLLNILFIRWFLYRRKDFKFKFTQFLLVSLIIVLVVTCALINSFFHIRSFKIKTTGEEANKELAININYAYCPRLLLKLSALEMLKRHPFLGIGLGDYLPYINKLNKEGYFKQFSPIYFIDNRTEDGGQYLNFLLPNDPHNDILQYFAETGILGGCAFIFFVASFLYLAFSAFRNTEDRYLKVRLFCFLASFISMLFNSLEADVFKLRHLWFMMAIILSLVKLQKKAKT